jgi:hypothetical protein
MLCTFLENAINVAYIAVKTSMKVESFVSRMVYRLYSLVWNIALNGPVALLSFTILSIKSLIDNIMSFANKLKAIAAEMKAKGQDKTKLLQGYGNICSAVLECRPLVEFFLIGNGSDAPMGISLVPGLYPENESNYDYWKRYNLRMKNRMMYFDTFINDVKAEIAAKSYDDLVDDFVKIKKKLNNLNSYSKDLETYTVDYTIEPKIETTIKEPFDIDDTKQDRFYFSSKIMKYYSELLKIIFVDSSSYWVSKNINNLDSHDLDYNSRIFNSIIVRFKLERISVRLAPSFTN